MERNSIWHVILAAALPALLRGMVVALLTVAAMAGALQPDAVRCVVDGLALLPPVP